MVVILSEVPSTSGFLWCAAAGETVTLVLAVVSLMPESPGPRGVGHLSYRRALPYAANTFLAYIYNRLDVLIVGALAGPSALAAYAPASRVQDAMLALPGAVTTVMAPEVARRAHSGDEEVRRLARRVAVRGFGAGVAISACLWLIAPALIVLLLGPAYEPSVGPTRVLIWFLPFAMVTSSALGYLIGTGRGRATTALFAISFGVSIGMHLSLDWWAGAMGAAVASLSRDPASAAAAWKHLRAAPPRH